MPRFDKIAFVASETKEAADALGKLAKHYGNADFAEADAIVALGGDGLMLQTMHRHLNSRIPIYGMNRGSVGFLLNDYHEDNLRERLKACTGGQSRVQKSASRRCARVSPRWACRVHPRA